jgi:hypothetical protein
MFTEPLLATLEKTHSQTNTQTAKVISQAYINFFFHNKERRLKINTSIEPVNIHSLRNLPTLQYVTLIIPERI